MSDCFGPEQRSAVMRAVKSRDTKPELRLRQALWRLGLRYRLGGCGLPGRPDLVFVRARLAVFVHGCFWHGHDCARGGRAPKQNADYWRGKIARNRSRDAASAAALAAAGWRVLVVWECVLARGAEAVVRAVQGASASARVRVHGGLAFEFDPA